MSATTNTVEPAALSRSQIVWQDPERMSGAACFAGTRVPVKALFDYLEAEDSINDFLDAFPGVSREQVLGALRLGKEQLLGENVPG